MTTEESRRRRRREARLSVVYHALGVLVILGVLAGVFGIRLLMTGGDVGCAFAQDPALCVAVKTVSP